MPTQETFNRFEEPGCMLLHDSPFIVIQASPMREEIWFTKRAVWMVDRLHATAPLSGGGRIL